MCEQISMASLEGFGSDVDALKARITELMGEREVLARVIDYGVEKAGAGSSLCREDVCPLYARCVKGVMPETETCSLRLRKWAQQGEPS